MIERKWRISSTLSLTWAPGGGGWWTSSSGRFIPGKDSVSLYRRLGGPESRSGRVRKISPLEFKPRTVQGVESRCTNYAMLADTHDYITQTPTEGFYPTTYSMSTESPFPGGKSGGTQTLNNLCVTSSFCRDLNEIYVLVEFHTVYIGSSVPRFRDIISVTRKRGTELPSYAA